MNSTLKTLAAATTMSALLLAPGAFAQSQPGAGAPSNTAGAPTPPNASIAPSMAPNGANMGTQASSATNSGIMSSDQSSGGQTAQPNSMRRSQRSTARPMTPSPNSTLNDPSTSTTPPQR